MSRLTGWRLAIRIARREALRARSRSLVALLMIALPVLAVTAADIILQTQDVSSAESLDRRLGAAVARVVVPAEGRPVLQGADPDRLNLVVGGRRHGAPPSPAGLSAALGGARLVPEREGEVDLRTDHGVGYAEALEVDLRDPLAAGLVRLTSGSLPTGPGEVVVNQAVLDQGYAVGDRLRLVGNDPPAPVVVGVAESATVRTYPAVAGPIGSLGLDPGRSGPPSWLVAGRPVPWSTVRALNTLGATVLSREVVEHPPSESQLAPGVRDGDQGSGDSTVVVVALVVVMALLEVVLLAGPAFAVGARRLAHSLALMAAAGGTPPQSRRVVLAGGLVLGTVAAVLGVVLGVGAGAALVPVVQTRSGSWFGPFDVPWLHLAGVAAFGLLSAVLAALVPAWIASRQDVVAVLAGRRADRRPSLRSPVVGLLLLGLGIAGSAYATRVPSNGEVAVAGSAVLAVVGMIFLVPVVVVLVARLAARLPLPVRYAARDAARHRTRTVPAVAAVAATVAGVVALGIAVTSDEAENEATYQPVLPLGVAAISDHGLHPRWERLRVALERELPGVRPTVVTGIPEDRGWVDFQAHRRSGPLPLDTYGGPTDASLLVAGPADVARLPGFPADRVTAARRVLADGGAVTFTNGHSGDAAGRLRVVVHPERGRPTRAAATVPLLAVHVAPGSTGPRAVLSAGAAEALGLRATVVGMTFDARGLSAADEANVTEALTQASPTSSVYIERGYVASQDTVIVQLVLAGLGAVLMVGGTLTATFLALSDARPDLATLSAVGASPRHRRGVAAAYALLVALVGAVLGAAVGFVPGIAVTYPLTAPAYSTTGPYLDVPWLLVVGLVVGLPALTAAVVAACTRSRLPLTERTA